MIILHIVDDLRAIRATRRNSTDASHILESEFRLINIQSQILIKQILIAEVAAIALVVTHVGLVVAYGHDIRSLVNTTLVLHRFLLLGHLCMILSLVREGAHLVFGATT